METQGINLDQLRKEAVLLNRSGLAENKVKIKGLKREFLEAAFVGVYRSVSKGKVNKIPKSVTVAYNKLNGGQKINGGACAEFKTGFDVENDDCRRCSKEYSGEYKECEVACTPAGETTKKKISGKKAVLKSTGKKEVKKVGPFRDGTKYAFVYSLLRSKYHTIDQLSTSLTEKFGGNTGKKGNVSTYVRTITKKTGDVIYSNEKGYKIK